MTQSRLFGLVEAGGTKFVLGLARGPQDILATTRLPTTTPAKTLPAMQDWFLTQLASHGPLDAMGIASFGPIELDRQSPQWGHITQTPKPGWSNTPLAPLLAARFGCPVGFDTDVNGAALAEYLWGAGQGQRSSLYFTIGTGIGGGAVIDGKILTGLSHPEMGHIRLPLHPDERDFAGVCPFHGACFEGLASGPAILARWGASLSDLPPDHPGHGMIAWYLAQAMVTMQAIFEPGRVILGGGVMATTGLIERVRQTAETLGNGYFRSDPATMICKPALGDAVGLLGALALAQEVLGS